MKKLREGSESEMADKDYDGDKKVESKKDEYMGSKDKAIKKAMGKKDEDKKEDENSEETIKESFNNFVKATLKKVFSLE
jgi:IS5 family transposase